MQPWFSILSLHPFRSCVYNTGNFIFLQLVLVHKPKPKTKWKNQNKRGFFVEKRNGVRVSNMISFSEDLLFLLKGADSYGHTYGLYGLNQAIDFGSLFSHIIVKQKKKI